MATGLPFKNGREFPGHYTSLDFSGKHGGLVVEGDPVAAKKALAAENSTGIATVAQSRVAHS